jgi:hypothetical protein
MMIKISQRKKLLISNVIWVFPFIFLVLGSIPLILFEVIFYNVRKLFEKLRGVLNAYRTINNNGKLVHWN